MLREIEMERLRVILQVRSSQLLFLFQLLELSYWQVVGRRGEELCDYFPTPPQSACHCVLSFLLALPGQEKGETRKPP